MSGNTGLITTKCKQREEINILNNTFDEFLIFFQLEDFDFECITSVKSQQIWTQKSKFVFL